MMAEISVDTDGRPGAAGGSRYVNGSQDLMDSHTTTDTNEYGQSGLRYADEDLDFMAGIGAAPPPEPEPETDDDGGEETVYVDEVTGEELTWDQLTEDERNELYEQELGDEAAQVQEEEEVAGYERLLEAYPVLSNPQAQDELYETAREVAVQLEVAEDDPGLAAELLESSAFYGAVMREEYGQEPILRGDDLLLQLWQERQQQASLWEAG